MLGNILLIKKYRPGGTAISAKNKINVGVKVIACLRKRYSTFSYAFCLMRLDIIIF